MKYDIAVADVVKWCEEYDGLPFHAAVLDMPYNLESIKKRFGKADSAPAKGDVYNRSAKGFMGMDWDSDVAFKPETWYGIARHLYPGGFILAAAGSRSWHRAASAMEDAGLIIHPSFFLYYSFGSGFPKATRVKDDGSELADFDGYRYGLQAIKPAVEPIICAQRPYEGRPVDCIQATGAGVWWVDGGRLPTSGESPTGSGNRASWRSMESRNDVPDHDGNETDPLGRWPSHLLLCHDPACRYTVTGWQCVSECAVRRLGEMSGERAAGGCIIDINSPKTNDVYGKFDEKHPWQSYDDSGTAARFFFNGHYAYETFERLTHADSLFYTSKASTTEREAGLQALPSKTRNRVNKGGYERDPKWEPKQRKNTHPTLKPLDLTRYLCQLLLPPATYAPRRILIPFSGASSEMIGAALAGWDEIQGVELQQEYADIGQHRLDWWTGQMTYGCTDPETILAAIRENSGDSGDDSQPRQLSLLDQEAGR